MSNCSSVQNPQCIRGDFLPRDEMKGAVINLAKNLNITWCQSWNVSFSGACMSLHSTLYSILGTFKLSYWNSYCKWYCCSFCINICSGSRVAVPHSPYHKPLVIFSVGHFYLCQSTFLVLSVFIHTSTNTLSCQQYIPEVFSHLHSHNCTHTQRVLSVVCNWSSVGTADLQTPAELTAAPGAVATRKHHAAGEEQARSSTQGEATDKQCTTSEYSSRLSDHTLI